MRLEMGHIYIKDIQFAAESKIEDGILYVSEEAANQRMGGWVLHRPKDAPSYGETDRPESDAAPLSPSSF